MINWTDIINKWGFTISYVRGDRNWYGGWSISFSFRRFHIGMGVNPKAREDYELS
jgi:hypothetical protein